jgi:hypothetical protein
MTGTDDPIRTGTGSGDTSDGGENLGPQEAARLLGQASQQARRRFEPNPPLLSLFRAVVVLVAFGGLWLSVHDQHPYKGPNAVAIVVCYLAVAVALTATAGAMKKASAGITRKDRWALRAGGIVLGTSWVAAYVFMGALHAAGASNAIVYGLYPATGPLMIVGLASAAWAAAREDWRQLGTSLGVAMVAMLSAFGGPRNCWLFMGIGLAVAMAAAAVATLWAQRSAVAVSRA